MQTNGQQLYYEVHGDGPRLVLVMGIGYDSSLWTLAQVPALSTQFRVVLVDNRDAGRIGGNTLTTADVKTLAAGQPAAV